MTEIEKYTKIGLGVMVFKDDGKVLMGLRKNTHGAGTYAIPGGHLEYMESFADCASREVFEECGITIKNITFQYIANSVAYAPKHYVQIGVTAEWESGDLVVKEPEKFDHISWYDLDNLPQPISEMSQVNFEAYKTGKNYFDVKK